MVDRPFRQNRRWFHSRSQSFSLRKLTESRRDYLWVNLCCFEQRWIDVEAKNMLIGVFNTGRTGVTVSPFFYSLYNLFIITVFDPHKLQCLGSYQIKLAQTSWMPVQPT